MVDGVPAEWDYPNVETRKKRPNKLIFGWANYSHNYEPMILSPCPLKISEVGSCPEFSLADDHENKCHIIRLRRYYFTVFDDSTDDFIGIFLQFQFIISFLDEIGLNGENVTT